jgi:predicted HAD superfamily Cof-like phosphohydrolase
LDWVSDVHAFHYKFRCYTGSQPSIPPREVSELRLRLVDEECGELRSAVEAGDLVGVADALADITYVVLGTALAFGIDLRPIWDLVQASNMAKVGGGERADGKILKPEGWKPPDIESAITAQAWK